MPPVGGLPTIIGNARIFTWIRTPGGLYNLYSPIARTTVPYTAWGSLVP
jgi:hypothetical protein